MGRKLDVLSLKVLDTFSFHQKLVSNNDQRLIMPWRPVLLLLASAGAGAIYFWPSSPYLAQGMGGRGMAADGAAKVGVGQTRMMEHADQYFIRMMIPHHDGAIAMADLALTRANRPEIKALASRIKASQTSQNVEMRDWYRQWFGQDVPAWKPAFSWGWQGAMGAGGMGMGAGGMGMHGATNLAALSTAKDFDRAFLEQMIPHHQMGVMMASIAQTNTQHPELRVLQQTMIIEQSKEIAEMQQWYRQWYQQ